MQRRAKELIELFRLSKHPEGGYFREVYRSEGKSTVTVDGEQRCWLTDIYFLLTENDISRFHRLRYDEVWHFYEGAPLSLIEIHPVSLDMHTVTIGQPGSFLSYKHHVKANVWQSATSQGPYSLIGCTVGPGFEYDDFEMLDHHDEWKAAVLSKHPDLEKFI